MVKEYHNHKLQTNPWHSEEESHNIEQKVIHFPPSWKKDVLNSVTL